MALASAGHIEIRQLERHDALGPRQGRGNGIAIDVVEAGAHGRGDQAAGPRAVQEGDHLGLFRGALKARQLLHDDEFRLRDIRNVSADGRDTSAADLGEIDRADADLKRDRAAMQPQGRDYLHQARFENARGYVDHLDDQVLLHRLGYGGQLGGAASPLGGGAQRLEMQGHGDDQPSSVGGHGLEVALYAPNGDAVEPSGCVGISGYRQRRVAGGAVEVREPHLRNAEIGRDDVAGRVPHGPEHEVDFPQHVTATRGFIPSRGSPLMLDRHEGEAGVGSEIARLRLRSRHGLRRRRQRTDDLGALEYLVHGADGLQVDTAVDPGHCRLDLKKLCGVLAQERPHDLIADQVALDARLLLAEPREDRDVSVLAPGRVDIARIQMPLDDVARDPVGAVGDVLPGGAEALLYALQSDDVDAARVQG